MENIKALKLVCAGMLQSWRLPRIGPDIRYTSLAPTKSGIAGMIACAMGYERGDSRISQLKNNFELYMNISESGSMKYTKKDRPLTRGDESIPDIMMDFQTVRDGGKGMRKADGKMDKNATITDREYIVAHRFVLYIVADEDLLKKIEVALNNPVWCYYLGSKCCTPSEPVSRGIIDIEKEKITNDCRHIRY